MAESLAPIDTSVAIPPAVRAAAERANAYYRQESGQNPEQPVVPAVEQPAIQPANAQSPEPQTPAPPPTPEPSHDTSEVERLRAEMAKQQRDYNALLGRNAQQREYIAMQQGQLQMLSNPRSWAQPNQPPQQQVRPRSLITAKEREEYGDEALSVMERKAREVVQPIVETLAEKNKRLEQELQKIKSQDIYQTLNQQMPNWRQINALQEWRDWLTLPDLYSGMVRQKLLDGAFSAGDAGRVLAFLRGFLAEYPEHTGQQSPATSTGQPASQQPARKPAMKLADLAAPGRASPSPPDAGTGNTPFITNKDVTRFYADVTHGRYAGREQEKAAREAQIHAAVRDGRVQFVK